jgi:hypothetical protein
MRSIAARLVRRTGQQLLAVRHRRTLAATDPGANAAINAALDWLCRAQDGSRTADGGVARHYGLRDGWGASYPETTGYIVPTLIDQAGRRGRPDLRDRAARMLDWLVAIQFPDGGFQGGMVDQTPRVPVTFNTGQILLGLAAGVAAFGEAYRPPMRRAADWLTASQDPDGKWSQHPTPFAKPGLKTYETHVSWGLFEAARLEPEQPWGEAGLLQVDWAIGHLQDNGWPAHCCLSDPGAPLTHTLGYTLRGIIEAWRLAGHDRHLQAALRLGRGLRSALEDDGRLPGRLDAAWRPTVPWVCLTGSVQVVHCWLLLAEATGDSAWATAGRAANAHVRRTLALNHADPGIRGGIAGSFPIDGEYGRFEYLNWAAKFAIDSWQAELDLDR